MQVLDAFSAIIVSLSAIVAIVAFVYIKEFNKTQKLFIYYVFVATFFEILARTFSLPSVAHSLRDIGIVNNLPGLHLFTLCQFVVLLRFFHQILKKFDFHFPLKGTLIFGIVMIIVNSIFFQSIFEFNSYSKTSVEIIIIFFSMVYFTKEVLSDELEDVDRSITLFVSAIFINAALSSLLHLFSNEIMLLEEDMRSMLWTLRYVINIITQLVILFGIFIAIRKTT